MKFIKSIFTFVGKLIGLLLGTLAFVGLVYLGLEDIVELIREFNQRRKRKLAKEEMDEFTR